MSSAAADRFFISLGEDKQAITVLRNHIAKSQEPRAKSQEPRALAYLDNPDLDVNLDDLAEFSAF